MPLSSLVLYRKVWWILGRSSKAKELDPWGEWLVRGRFSGASTQRRQRTSKSLATARDEVLRNAALVPGQSVLDLGAGTGLLALASRSRVTSTGRVIAVDISTDALRECVKQARRARKPTAALTPVAGDALRLPFASESFDAVLTRSVLMHINDKPTAVREMFRVLKTGGTASTFEAITDISARANDLAEQEIALSIPDYPRVRAHARGHDNAQLGFNERDLVQWFRDAGFRQVKLFYRESHSEGLRETDREGILRILRMKPHPSMLPHEEAAQQVLGDEATTYMEALVAWHLARGLRSHTGLA